MKEKDKKNFVAYSDERYTLGVENDTPYIIIENERYTFSCHPFEPCLYIKSENGFTTALHNSFEPFYLTDAFRDGKTVTSITGFKYTARDFCDLVDYVKNAGDIGIDDAERIFGDRKNKTKTVKADKLNFADNQNNEYGKYEDENYPDDEFYKIINEYPDIAVDYCIVKADKNLCGYEAHFKALTLACLKLFFEENGDVIWKYDIKKASGKEICVDELFSPIETSEKLNYRNAFLNPPYKTCYTENDFDKVNSVLFKNGTKALEVYKWTADWSEYFDDGNEWWGTLCYTVYDKSLNRFVVILASATD